MRCNEHNLFIVVVRALYRAGLAIDELPSSGGQTFTPPGTHPDWVLVLDDAECQFAPSGEG